MSRRWFATWAAAGAGVVLAVLLTAVGDPVSLMTPGPDLAAPRTPPVQPPPTTAPPGSSQALPTGSGEPLGPLTAFVGLLIQIAVVLVILLVLGVVIALLRSAWHHRPRLVSRPAGEVVAPDVPEELLSLRQGQLGLLSGGEPRNAIVATWLSLETVVGAIGLPREPAETSTEYTTRVLRTWDIDPRSLADLAALYREARFSQHALGEEHRRRAMRDLTTIHDDLAQVATETRGAPTT
ncbi:MAG: DUF4129 domain-containing protein [Intrasporangium sp.]|uniref:DUF4129 domain-containing protein n=1 Tax=Intrasporangium sp. TaxID=1925024 RepID=UPI002648D4EF|nr:DUF4129 domain-containing protein [Intrasporangium sp.]MDN5798382.1 DUF4129 domain-containing protein [Intrasporangium sp.]